MFFPPKSGFLKSRSLCVTSANHWGIMYRNMKFYTLITFFSSHLFLQYVFVLLLWNSDSVLICTKETLKFTAHFIKTVCTFISFEEAAPAVIWCCFFLALFRKVKWIWEPFHVALEFIQRFCVRIPFHNSPLGSTSFLKTSYNFSFCARGFCLLWCHWLLILKEGREQRWDKLLIFWISQMLLSGIWEFKAPILKEKGCRERLWGSHFPVAPKVLLGHAALNVAFSCWVQWSSLRSITFPESYKWNWLL